MGIDSEAAEVREAYEREQRELCSRFNLFTLDRIDELRQEAERAREAGEEVRYEAARSTLENLYKLKDEVEADRRREEAIDRVQELWEEGELDEAYALEMLDMSYMEAFGLACARLGREDLYQENWEEGAKKALDRGNWKDFMVAYALGPRCDRVECSRKFREGIRDQGYRRLLKCS